MLNESLNELLNEATGQFRARFHREPSYAVCAPGRVNLIGEHTDYNDGFVFPLAIERWTVAVAAGNTSGDANVFSTNAGASARLVCGSTVAPADKVEWTSYIQGVLSCCAEKGIVPPTGFDAVVHSNVPLGGGLSSSASLEVAVATLVEQMAGTKIDSVEKALLCQKAEHEFAKMPCGIMDQFISALGRKDHAMLLDCRTFEPTMVPLVDPRVVVLITNSNVKHALTGSEYPERRRACEEVSKLLDIKNLRDADMAMLNDALGKLDDTMYRRAKHVITENGRTLEMAHALGCGDWATAGELMFASHDSLRDDFEVSCPEIDALVEIARTVGMDGGVIGSRITGGGFGGCTVTLIRADCVDDFTKYSSQRYESKTGVKPTIFATRAAQGAASLF